MAGKGVAVGSRDISALVARVLAGHGKRKLTYGQLPVEGGKSYSVTISSPLALNMKLSRHADGQQTTSLPCKGKGVR